MAQQKPDSRLANKERWLAVLRIFAGLFFLNAGIPKLNSEFVGGMAATLKGFADGSWEWYRDFLLNTALPHATSLGYLVSLGEVAIGAALLLGLFTGLASIAGASMTINYYLATSHMGPASEGINLYATVVFIILLATQAGRVWGLDYYLARKWRGWILW